MDSKAPRLISLRSPCAKCGVADGTRDMRNGQLVEECTAGHYVRCVPKREYDPAHIPPAIPLTSKFATTCRGCPEAIGVGDSVLWLKGIGSFCCAPCLADWGRA